jgi:hypothetical protein
MPTTSLNSSRTRIPFSLRSDFPDPLQKPALRFEYLLRKIRNCIKLHA